MKKSGLPVAVLETQENQIGFIGQDAGLRHVKLADFPLVVIVSITNPLSRLSRLSTRELSSCRLVVTHERDGSDMIARAVSKDSRRPVRTLPMSVFPVDPGELVVDDDVADVEPEQHASRCVVTDRVALIPLYIMDGRRASVPLGLYWPEKMALRDAELGLIDHLRTLYENRRVAQLQDMEDLTQLLG